MIKKIKDPEKNRRTVFVGLSGGVDSAVSAALLKKQGFEVVGVFIKTWHPEFLECNEEEERQDAMRVAGFLDIPFLTFDLADVYKKEVGDYMIREYKEGRTPNPDVMCNKEVKFGAFLKQALAMGADYVATGHYAQAALRRTSDVRLFKGKDPSKDQSYFLWTLNQKQLKKILFPIGHLKKTEVRKLAKKFGLPVAEKKDSQGICFLGAVDLKDFLKHYIKEKKGKVLNEKGEEIGYHDGAAFHTLGERHGFVVVKKTHADKRYYIVGKDMKRNTLTVSQNPSDISLSQNIYKINGINWISGKPDPKKNYTAQIRYHGHFLKCKINNISNGKANICFTEPVMAASGQSMVIYDGNICMGGGVIR